MKIASTICSANYLPFAKSLADSLIEHNPDYTFRIVVLEKHLYYNHDFFLPHKLIFIEEMKISEFAKMNKIYTLFELSCALKPYVIEYFIKHNPSANVISYFDSDILVFDSLAEVEKRLLKYSVLLTPHICKPIKDDLKYPNEEVVLKAGIYNAGFFAVNNSDVSNDFLSWWKERMKDKCLNKTHEDQLWLNLVPVFFSGINVLTNPGYNVAYWNLQERSLELREGKYVINNEQSMVFYHYSGFDINIPEIISKYQDRYSFETRPELVPLYQEYSKRAFRNDYKNFSLIESSYGISKNPPPIKKRSVFKKLFKKLSF